MKYLSDVDGRIRLYVIHHAGGSSAFYRRWAKFFPEWIEPRFLDLPGRFGSQEGKADHNFASVSALIARHIQFDRPGQFAVFGHSMGALVGYAALSELEKSRIYAQRLIVSASRSPASIREQGVKKKSELSDDLLLRSLRRYGSDSLRSLLRFSPDTTPSDMLLKFLELIRRDYRVLESADFRCASQLSCPISAFAGSNDEVDCHTMASWAMATAQAFGTRIFDGDHFYLERSPREWAEALGELLQPKPTQSLSGSER